MNRTLFLLLACGVVLGVLAAGCAPPPSALAALQATAVPEGQATAAASPTPETTPLLPPTPTRPPDFNCIDCHSDASQLQLLAEEEDVPEPPSEGSG